MSIMICSSDPSSADWAARMMISAYSRDSRHRRASSRVYLFRIIVTIATVDRFRNRLIRYRSHMSRLFFVLTSSFAFSNNSAVYQIMTVSRRHVYRLFRIVSTSLMTTMFLTRSMNRWIFLKKMSLPECCIDSSVAVDFLSYVESKKPKSAAIHLSDLGSISCGRVCWDAEVIDRWVQNSCIIAINSRRCVSINPWDMLLDDETNVDSTTEIFLEISYSIVIRVLLCSLLAIFSDPNPAFRQLKVMSWSIQKMMRRSSLDDERWKELRFCDDGEIPTSLMLEELMTVIAHRLMLKNFQLVDTEYTVGAIICYGQLRRVIKGWYSKMWPKSVLYTMGYLRKEGAYNRQTEREHSIGRQPEQGMAGSMDNP